MYLRSNMASFWVAMLDFRSVAIGWLQPAYYQQTIRVGGRLSSTYTKWANTSYKWGPISWVITPFITSIGPPYTIWKSWIAQFLPVFSGMDPLLLLFLLHLFFISYPDLKQHTPLKIKVEQNNEGLEYFQLGDFRSTLIFQGVSGVCVLLILCLIFAFHTHPASPACVDDAISTYLDGHTLWPPRKLTRNLKRSAWKSRIKQCRFWFCLGQIAPFTHKTLPSNGTQTHLFPS